MQDMVGGDYFRTPVIFGVPDIFVFVGDKADFNNGSETTISGIVSIIEITLKITIDIVKKLRAFGCVA